MTLSPPQKVFIGANIICLVLMTIMLIIPSWMNYHYEYENVLTPSHNVVDARIAPFLYHVDDGYTAPGILVQKNVTGFIDLSQTMFSGLFCFITLIIMGVNAEVDGLKYEGHKGKVTKGWTLYTFIVPLLAILVIGVLQVLDVIKTWRFRSTHGVFKGGEPLTVNDVPSERSALLSTHS